MVLALSHLGALNTALCAPDTLIRSRFVTGEDGADSFQQ